MKNQRHFKQKKRNDIMWFFHISCVNHVSDFDAIGDVAIEFLSGNNLVCMIGAELGNIEGSGQKRFPVSNAHEAAESARQLSKFFIEIGLPFLVRLSVPSEVVSVLKKGGSEATLINPLTSQHQSQITSLYQIL